MGFLQSALSPQHGHVAHSPEHAAKGGAQKKTDAMLWMLLAFVVVCVAYFMYRKQEKTGGSAQPSTKDERYITAKMLHAAGAKVYGSKQCGYTVRQMEKFGPYTNMLAYIECGQGVEACKNIKGFPSWMIGGEELLGDQPLEVLRAAAEKTLRTGGANPAARQEPPPPADPVAFNGMDVHAVL